ncbi:MAG TPA: hypothetical protein VGE52_01960, partial [Pirellulales bacterium]
DVARDAGSSFSDSKPAGWKSGSESGNSTLDLMGPLRRAATTAETGKPAGVPSYVPSSDAGAVPPATAKG